MTSRRFEDWDEPAPLGEFDPELRQVSQGIDEDEIGPVASDLRVNHWVSTIPTTTALQRERISRLLSQFEKDRRPVLIRWLRKKEWTGDILVFFLEFLTIWEKRTAWWDSYHWDPSLRCWRRAGRPSRNSLTMDDAYKLVQSRLDRHPTEAIDDAWLWDWERLELWEKGFPSFASFAVFRSGFSRDDDWRQYIDWRARHDLEYDDADFDAEPEYYDEKDEYMRW